MDKYVALATAIENGKLEAVKAKLKEIEDVNHILESGDALIHYAVLSENFEIVKTLIENGCDVNIKDRYSGQTGLHYCAENGNLSIATLLIKNGGDLSITDIYKNEPLWTAVFNIRKNDKKRLDLVALFVAHGGNKNHKNKAGVSPLDLAKDIGFQPTLDVLK